MLRPFSKNIPHERLLEIIENNVDKCIKINKFLRRFGLKKLARFVPICDITDSFPESLSKSDFRAWTVDTFDQYSPEHDHPQRLKKVCKMFERNGADDIFWSYFMVTVGCGYCVYEQNDILTKLLISGII